jgi:hypothetical protein
MTTVKVEGVSKVIKKLDSLGNPEIMRRAMTTSLQHLHRRIAKYPPKPAHSTYRRTNTLGRGWTIDVTDNGRRGEVGIKGIRYARFVQGDRQRHFHKAAGWKTAQDVAEQEAEAVIGYFQKEYNKAIGK